MRPFRPLRFAVVIATLVLGTSGITLAGTGTLRIVTYNVNDDTNRSGALSNISTVFQGIGQALLPDGLPAQPIDVLAVEEMRYSGSSSSSPPSVTLTNLVGQLNSIYGAGTYAYDSVNDISDGNSTGNGPSGLIYNTHTVAELGVGQVIGSVGSSGAARAPMRYELEPAAGTAASQFYLYVNHAKSGTTSTDATRRNVEMSEIRANSAALGSAAHVIYTGDFNINSSSEASYHTLIASGVGQAVDPGNPGNNWVDNSSFLPLLSETATALDFRDDMQLMTSPTVSDPTGLEYVPGSAMPFANNGSVGIGHSITTSTAYPTLPNRSAVLSALTTATDHLPMVADYQYPLSVPEPTSLSLLGLGVLGLLARRRAK